MKKLVLNKIISAGVVLYFFILFIERLLAIILSISSDNIYALKADNPFAIITYVITCLSVVAGTILAIKPLAEIFKTLFSKNLYDYRSNPKSLIIAIIVILISGMMHTAFTISGVQFVAYGFLIASMLAITIDTWEEKEKRANSIISFIYLVCFSMAIPVCYIQNVWINEAVLIAHYVVQFLATAVLLFSFGVLLSQFFKEGISTFCLCYGAAVLVLDGAMIGLSWGGTPNIFVMIFAIATVVMNVFYFVFNKIKKA